jgi:hypothetical protein
MTGLNPSSADGARPRPALLARMARAYAELLAARPFRLTIFPNDVRSGSDSCACRRNQQ